MQDVKTDAGYAYTGGELVKSTDTYFNSRPFFCVCELFPSDRVQLFILFQKGLFLFRQALSVPVSWVLCRELLAAPRVIHQHFKRV